MQPRAGQDGEMLHQTENVRTQRPRAALSLSLSKYECRGRRPFWRCLSHVSACPASEIHYFCKALDRRPRFSEGIYQLRRNKASRPFVPSQRKAFAP